MAERPLNIEIMASNQYEPIREQYRKLQQKISDQQESDGANGLDVEQIRMGLLECNEIFSEVKRPREALLDSGLLKMFGKMARSKIETTQSNLVIFRPTEFAIKLSNSMTADSPNTSLNLAAWERIGRPLTSLYRRTAGIEKLCGVLDWQPKEKAARTSQKPDREIKAVKVTEKLDAGATGEEVQTEEVNRIFRILRKKYRENGSNPICYVSFIINPHNFSSTIENMFHCSFLVRDRHAAISEDEEGFPVIAPHESATGTGQISVDTNQCVIDMSMPKWKELIEVFEIKEPMIPISKRNKRPISK